jgi:antitoxin component of RelBE/YafQ-DinJ toxin-antitoxin module
MDELELAETEAVARRLGLSLSEWVRIVLRAARKEVPVRDAARKMAALCTAVQFQGPTSDIDQMLAEIASGVPRSLPE